MGLMARITLAATLFLAAGVLAPTLAAAQPATPTPADKKAAKEHYEAGKRAYNLGEFDTAIDEWTAGYKIGGDPIFLYNLGQAYRQKKDYKQAIIEYKAYLREDPNSKVRATVEQNIADMEKEIGKQPEPVTRPATLPATQPATHPATQPATRPATLPATQPATHPATLPATQPATQPVTPASGGGGTLKIAGIATGGVGVVALVGGVVFGLAAKGYESDVNTAVKNHEVWTPDLQNKADKGSTDNTLAIVGYTVGAVAIIAGGTLFYLGMRQGKAAAEKEEEDSMLVVPVIGPTTAGVLVQWTY